MQHGPLKRWYPTTTLHSVTTQQTSTWYLLNDYLIITAYNHDVGLYTTGFTRILENLNSSKYTADRAKRRPQIYHVSMCKSMFVCITGQATPEVK